MPDKLAGKTVDELRKLASARGLSGYSKLRKNELVRLLQAGRQTSAGVRPVKKHAKAGATGTPPAQSAKQTPAGEPVKSAPANGQHAEQRIESSKYALTTPGQPPVEQRFATDLGEDLDYLPAASEPVVCILPQKPGVVHAYWSLSPPLPAPVNELRLRLGRLVAEGVEIVEEIRLSSERGHWYFHVPESVSSGDYYLHLGSYRDGHFVTAIRRGIARIPRLFASAEIDRRWWVDEDRFREMYLRAGGELRRGRLAWPGSSSSPGGAGDSSVFSRRAGPDRR